MKKFWEVDDLEGYPKALPEGVNDEDDYLIATYYVELPSSWNTPKLAEMLAVEQSTGTWVAVPQETPEVRRKHVAKVTGVYEVPNYEFELPSDIKERRYLVQMAFPVVNFGSQIPHLLTAVAGNISMAGKVKLLDLKFPKSYTEGFQGPKFGIDGIRKILGVPKRPLLNNMIKPCTGYPPKVGAELLYHVAKGGADSIKDDELMGNESFNRIEDRVPLYMEAVDKAEEETGEKTLYSVNVTGPVSSLLENAEMAVELGANSILVNYLTVGLSAMRMLAEDPSIDVPVMAHMDFAGAIYESPWSGVSSHLILGKLPRICGADIIVTPAPYGKARILKERYMEIIQQQVFPLRDIKPSMPMPSGGIATPMVEDVINDIGYDIMLGSGGAIHSHPMGPEAGTRAFRQAIDAVMDGKSIGDAMEEYEELRVSIDAAIKALEDLKDLM